MLMTSNGTLMTQIGQINTDFFDFSIKPNYFLRCSFYNQCKSVQSVSSVSHFITVQSVSHFVISVNLFNLCHLCSIFINHYNRCTHIVISANLFNLCHLCSILSPYNQCPIFSLQPVSHPSPLFSIFFVLLYCFS